MISPVARRMGKIKLTNIFVSNHSLLSVKNFKFKKNMLILTYATLNNFELVTRP